MNTLQEQRKPNNLVDTGVFSGRATRAFRYDANVSAQGMLMCLSRCVPAFM